MKFFLVSIALLILLPPKTLAYKSPRYLSVCKNFETGKLDARKTLAALNLNLENYSIGVNNTAKIFCS